MIKRLVFITCMLLLVGCESQSTMKTYLLEDMTLVSKENPAPSCAIGCHYEVVLEKDGQEIQLRLQQESTFNALMVGVTVTVTFDSHFIIRSVTFPMIQNMPAVPPELDTRKRKRERENDAK